MTAVEQNQSSFTRPVLWWAALLPLAIAASLLAAWSMRQGLAWPCVFLNVTGFPCPTCGTTRSLAALAQLDLLSALKFNPLVVILGLGALVLPAFSPRVPRISRRGWAALALLVLANWLYLLFFLPA